MVLGSNLARGKYLQHLWAQLLHYIPLYIYNIVGGRCVNKIYLLNDDICKLCLPHVNNTASIAGGT